MFNIINTLFRVDSRALGIFRILLGWLCFWDIIRRWDYIDVFYSNLGIQVQYAVSKSFSIFHYIGNDSIIMHLVFAIGILFSILLMIGYKSKFSHFITATIIISIHVYVTKVGNSGDMFLNCMLFWTFFLPLGKSLSIDGLINSLSNFKETKVDDLNDRTKGINSSVQIYSIAYFAMLFQISVIYFFTALDKSGWDWLYGKALYKMHQLDGFVTPIGYFIREYMTYPISDFFTQITLYLEYSVPFLLFIPFYKHIFRLCAIIALTSFHIIIRLSINVGLFSQVMITSFPLLLDKKIINYIKYRYLEKYKNNKFTLFYDSDCGFCHYTVRIIKRLDVFNTIIFADSNTTIDKPKNFNSLADKTIILYYKNKLWTRHKAFGKILSLLPFGFLISWIFFIPFISKFFGVIYDKIAKNRTKISLLFGLPACNLPGIETKEIENKTYKWGAPFISFINHIISMGKILSPILILTMLVAASFSVVIENPGSKHLFGPGSTKINNGKKTTKKLEKTYSFGNMKLLDRIARFPRMIQMWKMFSPNVPANDKVIIVEAFITEPFTDKNNNGKWDDAEEFTDLNNNGIWNDTLKIDPFTGKTPILYSTDFKLLTQNKSQLWRKYFENFRKFDATTKTNKRSFKNWIMNPNNYYFKETLNNYKIDSIKIWKITQQNPTIQILINKKWDDAEEFTDLNNNGIWDNGDFFNDLNNNFKFDTTGYCWCIGGCEQLIKEQCEEHNFNWIDKELFEDINSNGKYDAPEPFKDSNRNKQFDQTAEEFTDLNNNGIWDKGEPFTDRVMSVIKYSKKSTKKECLNCKKKKNKQIKGDSNKEINETPDTLKDYFKKVKKTKP